MFKKKNQAPNKHKQVVKVQKINSQNNVGTTTEQIKERSLKSKLNFDRFKNRTTIGIACICLAFGIVFGISPLINKAASAQTVIVRVDKDIEKGQKITADKIEKVTVGGYNLPDNVVKRAEEVIGKYATADLKKGDYILTSKLSSDPFFNNPYLYNLPEGKVAMSVSLKSLAAGLSGKLQQGDIVSIIAVGNESGEKKAVQLPELTYVEVLAATTKKGLDINQQEWSGNNEQEELATVILSVNNIQALKLAEYEESGKLHMVLVSRGNEERKKLLLDAQDEYFSQYYKAENGYDSEKEGTVSEDEE